MANGTNNWLMNGLKAAGSAAAINNSQYGQTGNKILDFARPVIDFMGGAYNAYQSNPTGGGTAIPGLVGMTEGMSRRNYMNQLQQQYLAEQQRLKQTDANNAQIWNARTGQTITGPFDTTFANNSAGDIRKSNAVPSINNMLGGEALNLNQYGDYSDSMLNNYTAQQAGATNFLNRSTGLDAVQGGQGQSLLHKALMNMGNNPTQPQAPSLEGGAPTLSAGANFSRPAQQIDTGMSPFLLPTDVPTQIAGMQQAGLEDAQKKGVLDETTRSNMAEEKQERDIYNATVKNQGGYARYAPAPIPPQPSEATRAYQALQAGIITPEQYARTLGALPGTSEQPTIPSQDQQTYLENLKNKAQGKAGWFGSATTPDPAAAQQYNQYASRYGLPPLTGPTSNSMIQSAQNTGNAAVGRIRSAGEWARSRGGQ